MGALFALLLAVEPSIQIASTSRCADSASVSVQLGELVKDAELGKGFVATLEDAPSQNDQDVTIILRVHDAGKIVVLDRVIPEVDCKEAARTVATVLAVWMEVFRQNSAAPTPSVTTQVFAPRPLAPPSPVVVEMPAQRTVPVAIVPHAWDLLFAGRLGSDLAVASDSDPGFTTAFAAGMGQGPWQGWFSLELGATHSATLTPQGSSVAWNRNTFGVSVARVFREDTLNWLSLRLGLGARLAMTDASGVGVAKSGSDAAMVLGLGANAALLLRTGTWIRPVLQLGGNFWPGRETVRISGVPAGDLPRSDLSITLGFEIAFKFGDEL
jgi:hypothetical protein